MRWRRLFGIGRTLAAVGVILGFGSTGAAWAADATPSLGVQTFASAVETLGQADYPDSFTGVVLEPSGVTAIYAPAPISSELTTAVSGLNTGGYPVSYTGVARSFSELKALNDKLGNAEGQLQTQGIQLASSAPDPFTGTVSVTLAAPTAANLDTISASSGSSITSAGYPSAAAAVIQSDLGAGYNVAQQYSPGQAYAADRYSGVAPFNGGDEISGGEYGATCTGGFSVTDNFGLSYMLTAGHCGKGTWYTPAALMGTTEPGGIYFEGGNKNDFQLLSVVGGVKGNVWGNYPNLYPVIGRVVPPVGVSAVTVDGAATGERTEQGVISSNATIYHVYDSLNDSYFDVSPVTETESNGESACQKGDSGGPMFQRTSGSGVNAVGTITAFYDTGQICAAQQIGHELNTSNTELVLNG